MKYWMLTLSTCLFVLSSVVRAESVAPEHPTSSPVVMNSEDPLILAESVFREGLVYCNDASKASRIDTDDAKSAFAQYLSHRERAKTIFPAILEQEGFIQRETKRCDLVQDNIARAEAMPLIEQGLAVCEQSRAALSAANLSQAETLFQAYVAHREQALQKTPTVLRVGSVAVKMRLCDGLAEKIELTKVQLASVERKVSQILASYDKAAESCTLGQQLMKNTPVNDTTLASVQTLLKRSQALQQDVTLMAESMLTTASADSRDDILSAQRRVQSCNRFVVSKVQKEKARQAQLAASISVSVEASESDSVQPEVATVPADTARQAALTEAKSQRDLANLPAGQTGSVIEGREMVQIDGPDL